MLRFVDTETLRFVCPSCTWETDSIAVNLSALVNVLRIVHVLRIVFLVQ